jgi:hypothetical protein
MYVGKYLFNPAAQDEWTYEDDYLAQMMELNQVTKFPPELLQRSNKKTKFFDEDGKPR